MLLFCSVESTVSPSNELFVHLLYYLNLDILSHAHQFYMWCNSYWIVLSSNEALIRFAAVEQNLRPAQWTIEILEVSH
jgi:hypothetical protein